MKTGRLELVLPSVEETRVWIEGMSPDQKQQLSADWLAMVERATEPDPWVHGFSMVRRKDAVSIGECGFKGPPDSDGVVEIAYHVFSEYEGNGYATEAGGMLVDYAFSEDAVSTVCAHTLPEHNASTRILTKCGFDRVGEVMDPDDGLVWRWERRRDAGIDRGQ